MVIYKLIARALEVIDAESEDGLFRLGERTMNRLLAEHLTRAGVPAVHEPRYPNSRKMLDITVFNPLEHLEIKKACPVNEKGRGQGLSIARIVSNFEVNQSAPCDCGKLVRLLPPDVKKTLLLVGFDSNIAPIDELFDQFAWVARRRWEIAAIAHEEFELRSGFFSRGVVAAWSVAGLAVERRAASRKGKDGRRSRSLHHVHDRRGTPG